MLKVIEKFRVLKNVPCGPRRNVLMLLLLGGCVGVNELLAAPSAALASARVAPLRRSELISFSIFHFPFPVSRSLFARKLRRCFAPGRQLSLSCLAHPRAPTPSFLRTFSQISILRLLFFTGLVNHYYPCTAKKGVPSKPFNLALLEGVCVIFQVFIGGNLSKTYCK